MRGRSIVSAAASCLALATPAAAQTAAGTASAPPDQAPAGGIPEITVTAQRVTQRLQDVPLSITALSGDTLRNARVTAVDRLEQLVPGLRIGRSGTDVRPAMRGTTTEGILSASDPRFGIYVDEIYQSRTSQVPPIVDLDRVEVQKGPQGTLYGRNSFGGNIAFYSAAPKDDALAGGIDLIYGSYDRKRAEAFVNVPLTAGIAARVAGLYEKTDGYVKNIGTGPDLADEDQYFVRGAVRIAPPSLEDRLIVDLRGSYWRQGGAGSFGFGYKQLGTLVDVDLIRPPGGSITVGGRTYVFPQGFNGASFSGTPFPIDTQYRDGVADINGADIGVPVDPDPYRVNFDSPVERRVHQQQYSGSLSFDTGPVTLRSITSYTKFGATRGEEDGTPVPYFDYATRTTTRTFTQEVQLLQSDKSSPLQWIVGGYYFDDDVKEYAVTKSNRQFSTAGELAAGRPTLYYFYFTYFPSLANFDGIDAYQSDYLGASRSQTRSLAGYAQVSYTFADKLTVTGGYRYTSDRKRFAAALYNDNPVAPAGSTIPAFYAYSLQTPVDFTCNGNSAADTASNATNISTALLIRCGRKTFKFSTFRGAADYKFDRDHMIYASVSTGRHSGGFNGSLFPGSNQLYPFNPEKVTAYEIGSKNRFLDGTVQLNLAAFRNDYRDLQAQTSIPDIATTGVLALIQNIGKDRAYGVDVEAVLKPTRALTVNLAFNWLHARELDYKVNTFSYGFCGIVAGNCADAPAATLGVQGTPFPNPVSNPERFVPLLDASGNQVVAGGVPQYLYVIAGETADGRRLRSRKALQPEYTVQIGVAYEIDLGSAGTITPSVQSYFNSGYILTDLTPDFGNQKAYTKTDLALSYATADGRITGQVFVNNVEDKPVINRVAYSSNRSLSVNYAEPRTWGVRLGYRF